MLDKNELIHKIQQVCKQYPYIVKAELFGSYARNEARQNSDVDLLVEYDLKQNQKLGFELLDFDLNLEQSLACKVNVCTEKTLFDFILKEIANERQVVYDSKRPAA